MNKGETFAGNLTILGLGGAGGTANVYKAFDDESQCIVALKIFENSALDPNIAVEIWNREVKALESLRHQAIARMLRAGRDPESDVRFIVLQKALQTAANDKPPSAAPSPPGETKDPAAKERQGGRLGDRGRF